ncbi:MAG: YncE family protein [Terriglobia bacterium]
MKIRTGWWQGVVAAVALLGLAAAPAAQAQKPYDVAARWKVGGVGWWDYMSIDPVSHDLYITRGNHVMVLNSTTGHMIADIAGLKGTHGVVFAKDGVTGFISDGGADDVAYFNRKTNEIKGTVPAGKDPDGITYDPYTNSVWAFNGRSDTATVIDARTKKVLATVALPGKPEFPVSDGKGNIYDNIESKSEIVRINAKSHRITAVWPLAPCEHPSGLAMDAGHMRLFSVCHNGMMAVVNAENGKVVATPAIGMGPDAARFDVKGQYALSTNGGTGTLTVIHEDSPDHYSEIETAKTQKGARTMAMMPGGSRLYTVTVKFGQRPKPTAAHPHPYPTAAPNSFVVIELVKP